MSKYKDIDGNPIELLHLCQQEPAWAANRIAELEQENEAYKNYYGELTPAALDLAKTLDERPEQVVSDEQMSDFDSVRVLALSLTNMIEDYCGASWVVCNTEPFSSMLGSARKLRAALEVVSDKPTEKQLDALWAEIKGWYWIGSCGEVGEKVSTTEFLHAMRAALEGK